MSGPLSDLFASGSADGNDDVRPASSLEGDSGDGTQSALGFQEADDSADSSDTGFATFASQPATAGDPGAPSDAWLQPQGGDDAAF